MLVSHVFNFRLGTGILLGVSARLSNSMETGQVGNAMKQILTVISNDAGRRFVPDQRLMPGTQSPSGVCLLATADKNPVGRVTAPGNAESAAHLRWRSARGGRGAPEVAAGIEGKTGRVTP